MSFVGRRTWNTPGSLPTVTARPYKPTKLQYQNATWALQDHPRKGPLVLQGLQKVDPYPFVYSWGLALPHVDPEYHWFRGIQKNACWFSVPDLTIYLYKYTYTCTHTHTLYIYIIYIYTFIIYIYIHVHTHRIYPP